MLKHYFLLTLFVVLSAFSLKAQQTPPVLASKDTAICYGSSIDLNSLILSKGTTSSTVWYKQGESGGMGINSLVSPLTTTNYILRYLYPSSPQFQTITVKIRVSSPPQITAMGDVAVCEGTPVELKLLSATDVEKVWWQQLGKPDTYPNNSIITPNEPNQTGNYELTYRVYARNSACPQVEERDVKIKVSQALPTADSIRVVDEYSYCIGEIVDLNQMLSFVAINNKGNREIIPATDARVSNLQVSWSAASPYKLNNDATLYATISATIKITNTCATYVKVFTNETFTIKVKTHGTKAQMIQETTGTTANAYPAIICEGDSAIISILSGSCSTIEKVEWISPAIGSANQLQATGAQWKYYWKPTASTVYRAKVFTKSQSSGTIDTEILTLTIDVKKYPKLVAIADTTVCSNLNQTIDLNGLLNTWSYVGQPNWGGVNPVLSNVSASKTYQVKAMSGYRCQNMDDFEVKDSIKVHVNTLMAVTAMPYASICKGESVTLTAQAGGNIFWSKSIGGAAIPATQTPATTTIYYVNGKNSCGLSVDSVMITVNTAPALTLRPDTTICKGVTIGLYASNCDGDSILWNINSKWVNAFNVNVTPAQTTKYTAVAYKNGCQTSKDVTITVNAIPTLKAMDDAIVCKGSSIQLTAQSSGTITWNVSNTTVTPLSDTSFYAMATNGACAAYDTVKIKVVIPPSVKAMDDVEVCYGETIQLTTINSNGQIKWNVPSTIFKATQSGSYTVTASCEHCPDVTDVVNITVGEELYIRPDKLPRYKQSSPYNMQLETNANAPYYNMLNGSLPSGFSLSANGTISGTTSSNVKMEKSTFTVELTDAKGCKAEKEFVLEGETFISNVFTPNGDGVNDYFMQGYHVIIFNRLGVKIFEGNDGWDGTYKGKIVPVDTYFYIVTLINEDGKSERRSGSISIVSR